jgi:eukaryotic-like serine/threonine-protein kinase
MTFEAQRRLFEACLEAVSDAEREQMLQACDDAALREEVRALLRAHVEVSGSMPESASVASFPRMSAPHRIGPYRILERLGEGAMGEVYLAEQQAPVRRRVALKILKFGLATREVIGRFELERQALAVLAHPNIARIFDAGQMEDGRPYFALEYVAGEPITKYCDERRLDLEARIALFKQVCAGAQHAHLRGIIHRDLKPSNLLVTEVDGQPVPKIIDFGIAKATTSERMDTDVHTRLGNLLGTPEYMSPEQAQLSPLDIDTRTDVYSLGIVLYELLVGSRPYSLTRDTVNPVVLMNEIVTREAKRPSDAAKVDDAEAAWRATCRRASSPAALAGQLRDDLDWIVLKAIEKDRQRRYDTPASLADDLQRHADNVPVVAGPPSTVYRFNKFVRRHRWVVATLGAFFLAAILFGTGMFWLAREASAERDRANLEAEVSRQVTAFTAGLFEQANPMNMGSSDVSARQLLDAGVRRLEQDQETQRADVRAALLEAAGNGYRGLGVYAEAERLLTEAADLRRARAESEPVAYARTLINQALVSREQGELELADTRARAAVALFQNASEATVDERHMAVLELADILRRRGEFDEAAKMVEPILSDPTALAPKTRVRAVWTLGRLRLGQGKVEEALETLEEAYDLQLRTEGPLAEMTFETKSALADAYVVAGQSERAEPLLRGIVQDVRKVLGEEHGGVGIALNNLGNALSDIPERFGEAAEVYLGAIAIISKANGPEHLEVGTAFNNLGALYLKTKEWAKADDAYRHAIAIRMKTIGATHNETASSEVGRALALNKLDRYKEAEALLRAGIATYTGNIGAEHWRTANARRYLASVLLSEGKVDEAKREMDAAYPLLEKGLGADHPRVVSAREARAEIDAAYKKKESGRS